MNDLDHYVNDSILMQTFKRKYPSVIQAKVVLDSLNRTSKGYGFIKFESGEESNRALKEMNGQMILTKAIKLR